MHFWRGRYHLNITYKTSHIPIPAVLLLCFLVSNFNRFEPKVCRSGNACESKESKHRSIKHTIWAQNSKYRFLIHVLKNRTNRCNCCDSRSKQINNERNLKGWRIFLGFIFSPRGWLIWIGFSPCGNWWVFFFFSSSNDSKLTTGNWISVSLGITRGREWNWIGQA